MPVSCKVKAKDVMKRIRSHTRRSGDDASLSIRKERLSKANKGKKSNSCNITIVGNALNVPHHVRRSYIMSQFVSPGLSVFLSPGLSVLPAKAQT